MKSEPLSTIQLSDHAIPCGRQNEEQLLGIGVGQQDGEPGFVVPDLLAGQLRKRDDGVDLFFDWIAVARGHGLGCHLARGGGYLPQGL